MRAIVPMLLGLAAAAAPAQPPSLPDVPVTRVIAIGTVAGAGAGAAAARPSMQREVGDTVQLYLAGRIDQWYVRKDRPGVVFILNAASVEEARGLIDALPLSKAGIMRFELIPAGPLAPLGLLVK